MLSIQTNVNSLNAQQNLNVNNQFMSQTIQQLTSGYRINSSGDDAAGLAVANQLRDNISQVTQGVANGNDGVAQLQIMDGGISNISQILDRLQTLATQSASASFTGDRTTLNNEFQTDIQEINRQAQAIGLNTGGTFASNLAIYLGGGSGTTSAATMSNGTVSVNLSNSTVDAQSLGLSSMQATNSAAYDLGVSSATSVYAILSNQTNQGGEATPTSDSTVFNFNGPGFGSTANPAAPISVKVNLAGVTGTSANANDITNLVNNINSAIQAAGAGNAAFAAAGITASVVTNALGGQQIAFNSSQAGFSVTSGDLMASALMGSFDGTTPGEGNVAGYITQVASGSTELGTAGANGAANTAADLTLQGPITTAAPQTITISDGGQNSVTVNLTAANTASLTAAGGTLATINQALQDSGNALLEKITAVQTGSLTSKTFNFVSTLPGFTVTVGADANDTSGTLEGVTSASMVTAAQATTPQAISDTLTGMQVGTASTADISTLAGATSAVSSVSNAVLALGAAQAAIGKGENQLNYAINLATSQITNFSAAESQIRDADIAQEAANLTKAQTLQQASIAAMAQANSAPQAVLTLLKS
ncbi:MAG TPA: flagellin [Bryobacteraceae bacterium]|nr:flagellin [Bryobacteraceae bacterium]